MALGNWISGASKWIETVEKATDAVISSLGVTPVTSVFAPVGLGLSAVLKSDRIGAENFSEVLEITQKMRVFRHVSMKRIMGNLHGFLGDFAITHAHLEDALVFCRAGWLPTRVGLELLRLRRHPAAA